jgi:hypothetical protein
MKAQPECEELLRLRGGAKVALKCALLSARFLFAD